MHFKKVARNPVKVPTEGVIIFVPTAEEVSHILLEMKLESKNQRLCGGFK